MPTGNLSLGSLQECLQGISHSPIRHYVQNLIKTIFIGVVGEVNEENEFDGEILLERISENKILNRMTYQNNYHHDRETNDALKAGEWRELYPDDPAILTSKFLWLIVEFFNLDDTGEYLCRTLHDTSTWSKMNHYIG
jgi:hypothetical protein